MSAGLMDGLRLWTLESRQSVEVMGRQGVGDMLKHPEHLKIDSLGRQGESTAVG